MTTDARIESLETQVRTLKRMLFGVFGVVIVGGLLAATTLQSVPDVIRAKSFMVMNDEGKAAIDIYADQISFRNGGAISLYNKDRESGVSITASPHGGKLLIFNKDGKSAASLGGSEHGGSLSLSNKDGNTAASLSGSPHGGSLFLSSTGSLSYSKTGDNPFSKMEDKVVVVLAATKDGGLLGINSNDGKSGATLLTSASNQGVLIVRDDKGNNTSVLPTRVSTFLDDKGNNITVKP